MSLPLHPSITWNKNIQILKLLHLECWLGFNSKVKGISFFNQDPISLPPFDILLPKDWATLTKPNSDQKPFCLDSWLWEPRSCYVRTGIDWPSTAGLVSYTPRKSPVKYPKGHGGMLSQSPQNICEPNVFLCVICPDLIQHHGQDGPHSKKILMASGLPAHVWRKNSVSSVAKLQASIAAHCGSHLYHKIFFVFIYVGLI